jgi:hypothetical protein
MDLDLLWRLLLTKKADCKIQISQLEMEENSDIWYSLAQKRHRNHWYSVTQAHWCCAVISMCKKHRNLRHEPICPKKLVPRGRIRILNMYSPIGTPWRTKSLESSEIPLSGWNVPGKRNARPYFSDASFRHRTNRSEFLRRVISSSTRMGAGVDSRNRTSSFEGL